MLLPICVDLDETLIRDDITKIAMMQYLKQNFLHIWKMFFWLCRGIAYFKQRLAEVVSIAPEKLSYNENFLEYVKQRKSDGHKIFLATGCNERYAQAVANYLKIFDGVFASNEQINLRGKNKADKLKSSFGNDFIYAGNSSYDIPVWKLSKEAILVAPTKGALLGMRRKKYRLFE